MIDSNSDPKGIDFPVPGNDDALRAINLYCDLVAGAVFDGLQSEVTAKGGDLGEAEEGLVEDIAAAEEVSEAMAAPQAEAPVEAPVEAPAEVAAEAGADAPAEAETKTDD